MSEHLLDGYLYINALQLYIFLFFFVLYFDSKRRLQCSSVSNIFFL